MDKLCYMSKKRYVGGLLLNLPHLERKTSEVTEEELEVGFSSGPGGKRGSDRLQDLWETSQTGLCTDQHSRARHHWLPISDLGEKYPLTYHPWASQTLLILKPLLID